MKIIKKFFYTLLFVIVFLILMQISTQARSYSIEEMNIQATVLDNGDVNIKQSITYDFNDVYNGIYINIPYVIEDKEYDDVIENSKIRDSLYIGSGITINSITDGTFKVNNINNYNQITCTNGVTASIDDSGNVLFNGSGQDAVCRLSA